MNREQATDNGNLANCIKCAKQIWYMTKRDVEKFKAEFPEEFTDYSVLCENCESDPSEEVKEDLLQEMRDLYDYQIEE